MPNTVNPETLRAIASSTDTSPIALTFTANHGLASGAQLLVKGHLGNVNANGKHLVTVTGANTLTLDSSTATGAGAGGATGFAIAYLPGGFAVPSNGDADDADADKAAYAALADMIAFTRGLTVLKVEVWTASGTTTVPDGASWCRRLSSGGGGSGGGGAANGYSGTGRWCAPGGAGAGGQLVIHEDAVTPGQGYDIVIGAGGVAVAAGANGLPGAVTTWAPSGGAVTTTAPPGGGGYGAIGSGGLNVAACSAGGVPGGEVAHTSGSTLRAASGAAALAMQQCLARILGEGGFGLADGNGGGAKCSADGMPSTTGYPGGVCGNAGAIVSGYYGGTPGGGGGGGAFGPGGNGGSGGIGINGGGGGAGTGGAGTDAAANTSGGGGGGGAPGASNGIVSNGGASGAGGSGKMIVIYCGAPQ